MPRTPAVWFPAPESAADVTLLGPGGGLSPAQVAAALWDPGAEELRGKVGVAGGADGSAKVSARLLRRAGWFFKTDTGRAGDHPGPLRQAGEALAALARRVPAWHPGKCWFLFWREPQWWLCSYCPELATLRPAPGGPADPAPWTRMLGLALDLSSRHGFGVDLNPSNFGTAADGRLYYLDDEVYPPLTMQDVGEALAARIPELPGLGPDGWAAWGHDLRDVIAPHTGGVTDWHELATGVGDYPLTPRFRASRDALIGALLRKPPARPAPESPRPTPEPAERPAAVPAAVPAEPPAAAGRLTCVLADVHGNLPALRAVLAAAAAAGADSFLVLGDVVGYGPFPAECVARVRSLPNLTAVRGNHDHLAAADGPLADVNRVARLSLEWTRARLPAADRAWLGRLPAEHRGPGWLAVHGAPCCPDRFTAYVYEPTYRDNLTRVGRDGLGACFYGHTHVPFVHRRSAAGDEKLVPDAVRLFRPGEVALVNPGAVGQPRDGDPRAAFALWDRRTDWVSFQRVGYPIDETTAATLAAGLPEDLARRLEIGR